MYTIKRKILLEDSIDRSNGPKYGTLTASTFYLNVFLTQNIDDAGLFTDIPVDQTSKLASDYFSDGVRVTGYTESLIEDLRTYKSTQPFIIGFNTNSEVYINHQGSIINGVDRVTELSNDKNVYTIGTNQNDPYIGTTGQTTGILYTDYLNENRLTLDNSSIPVTSIDYQGEGWNSTNTSYSALTKEEYLFGIISPPEVKSDVFIDRGVTSVLDKHLMLGEIRTLDELVKYGNGLYNINKI
jgi:hypothetical protein